MDQFVILSWLEKHTGIESSSWVMFFTFVVFISNFVSRRIPDDATGWKKAVKEVTKFIGLYTPNKLTKDTTATDILREQVEERKQPASMGDVTLKRKEKSDEILW